MPIDLIFPELKNRLKMFSCRMVIYVSTDSPEEKNKTYLKNFVKFEEEKNIFGYLQTKTQKKEK